MEKFDSGAMDSSHHSGRPRLAETECRRRNGKFAHARRVAVGSFLLIVSIAASGATCIPWMRTKDLQTAPVMFDRTPPLPEIIYKLNANTLAVKTLQADAVRISAPGIPTLKASLAVELPRRLRLRGDLMLSRELDIGSNDDVFWIWGKNWTRGLLYVRHDQLHLPGVRQWLPWTPQWLFEALGLVYLDPTAPHHGPYAHGPGAMEVHTQMVTPSGEVLTKVLVVHSIYGWILEQQVRNERGEVLIGARLSQHRFYDNANVTLPSVVEIEAFPKTRDALQLRLDLGVYHVNEPLATADVFTMPVFPDYPAVDLADPEAVRRWRSSWEAQPVSPSLLPVQAYRPEYRGYTRR